MELIEGKEYKRTELHNFYGGQDRGGISTPSKNDYIFIISYKSGEDYGYKDGWDERKEFYLYTGEGQIGDMEFKRGNKAIRDHQKNKKKLLLFKETKKTFIELIGEMFFVDYDFIQTNDFDKNNRKAIQFKLQKLKPQIHSDTKSNNDQKLQELYIPPNITERKGLVTSRVGQGKYRRKLIAKFQGKCAITKTNIEEILIASHIVPWRLSNDKERLDEDNGILLSPLYDALFDKHLISFQDDGTILISKSIKEKELISLINKKAKIEVNEGMKKYLEQHRKLLR
ncbi:HNH endonuclease [Prochlorococcus sp. AH-736-N10]|nr:HNH endonuclease [Prochlorococcus sp. AH-736-N10]